MAQLLNCRMFQGEAALEDAKKEISNTQVFKSGHKHLVDALSLDTHSLQQWVRAACLSEASGSARYKQWLAMVVKPCLDCTIAFIPANFQDIASRFTAILGGGEATEEDALRLKLACSAIKGELTSHPLVCGLALQCSRFVNKKNRQIHTMAGRRSWESDYESGLIADAGQQLALASGNYNLGKEFGISPCASRVSLDELKKLSLPTPALALRWPSELAENWRLCDQRFVRASGDSNRALASCF